MYTSFVVKKLKLALILLLSFKSSTKWYCFVCCKVHMLMRQSVSLTYLPASISITEPHFCVFNTAFVCLVQHMYTYKHTRTKHTCTHFLSISHSISLPLFLIGKGESGGVE